MNHHSKSFLSPYVLRNAFLGLGFHFMFSLKTKVSLAWMLIIVLNNYVFYGCEVELIIWVYACSEESVEGLYKEVKWFIYVLKYSLSRFHIETFILWERLRRSFYKLFMVFLLYVFCQPVWYDRGWEINIYFKISTFWVILYIS